jgi:hypothetical protein
MRGFWTVMNAAKSTRSETPHPSAFGRHLLPQGEKEF